MILQIETVKVSFSMRTLILYLDQNRPGGKRIAHWNSLWLDYSEKLVKLLILYLNITEAQKYR